MPEFYPPVYDAVAYWGIIGIAVTVAVVFVRMAAKGLPNTSVVLMTVVVKALMAISGILAAAGILAARDVMPPPMVLLIACVLALACTFGLGRFGAHLASNVPLMWLVSLQMFRLPLELVMHHGAERGILPMALSYGGYNYDIITGVGALLLFIIWKIRGSVSTSWVWTWNVIGIVCLAVITVIAIITSPMLHKLGTEPEHLNSWVLYFPYVWVPVVLVCLAVLSHIVITRILLRMR